MIDPVTPLHTHVWGWWETVAEGDITRDDLTVGRYLDQQRKCKTCGKSEIDTQVAYIDDD